MRAGRLFAKHECRPCRKKRPDQAKMAGLVAAAIRARIGNGAIFKGMPPA
jgi:hypothetical protein